MPDQDKPGRNLASRFGVALMNTTGRVAKSASVRFGRSSIETKTATAGGAVLGTAGLMTGGHIGIAALGTAISGAVVLPVAGIVVGALAGYAVVKAVKDKTKPKAKE